MDCQITVQQELQKQDAMLSMKLKSHDQQVPAHNGRDDVVKEKTANVVNNYIVLFLVYAKNVCKYFKILRAI